MQATSGLESLSSYHEGKVHKAEAQLAALEKQVRAQETAIKSKDETNIKALKMEVVPLPLAGIVTPAVSLAVLPPLQFSCSSSAAASFTPCSQSPPPPPVGPPPPLAGTPSVTRCSGKAESSNL